MPWPDIEAVRAALTLPMGVEAVQLGRSDLAEWAAALASWHPDLAIGEEAELLDAASYEHEALLRDEPATAERALYILILRHGQAIVAGIAVEHDPTESTVIGRMSVVSPAWRGRGLGRQLVRAQEALGRGLGVASEWGLTELDNIAQRRLLESEGWWLSGIIPESDQRRSKSGEPRYVPELLYTKPRIPEADLIWPEPSALTPQVAELFSLLKWPGSPLPIPPAPPAAPPRRAPPQLSDAAQQRLAARLPEHWPAAEILTSELQLPAGFTLRQQARRDIPTLIAELPGWHRDLPHSTHRSLLDAAFHEQQVALSGEEQRTAERPYFCFVLERDDRLCGLTLLSIEPHGRTLTAELGIIDPRCQQQGLMQRLVPVVLLMAQALGVETLISWASLRHPGAQRVAERVGLELWGIVPAAEVYDITDGRERRGCEAVYGLSLIPAARAQWPSEAQVAAKLHPLLRFVRDQRCRS